MKPLKIFAIGAEVAIVSTLAVSSYTLAFAGQSSISWFTAAPLGTLLALETLRLPIAFNLIKCRLLGRVMSAALIAGISVVTFEASNMGFVNLILQRTHPVVEAERALDKVQHAYTALKDKAANRDNEVKQLAAELATARAHRADIDKPLTLQTVSLQPVPPNQPPPVLQPIPEPKYNSIKTKKGWQKYQSNQSEIDAVRKANEKAQSDVVEANRKGQEGITEANRVAQGAVDKANGELQAAHSAELQQADAKVAEADAQLRAIAAAPDLQTANEAVKAAELALDDTKTMNPMYQVAAAWQRTPATKLSNEQFEQVRHWAVIALSGAAALVTALVAVVSELPERQPGPSKLRRALRAWIARRRRPLTVVKLIDVPGPETIKEVEIFRDVPGPETVKEVEVIKEVPGPVEYRPAPGPVEYRDVPGPERVVEKVVVKWVPYDINTGLRIKSDGSLGEVANLRSA
jgi:hypothetical protein